MPGLRYRGRGLFSFVATRYQHYSMIVVTILQVPYWQAFGYLVYLLDRYFHLPPAPSPEGIPVMAVADLTLVVMSYALFIGLIRRQGAEANRIRK